MARRKNGKRATGKAPTKDEIRAWLGFAGIMSELEERLTGTPLEIPAREMRREAYRRAVEMLMHMG